MASYADYYGIVLPDEADVATGVDYGWAGTELTGTLSGGSGIGDALEATSQEILGLAEQILAAISAGEAVARLPVTETGGLTSPLVIGDDYLAANSRAFEWTVAAVAGMTVSQVSASLGMRLVTKDGTYEFEVTGTVTDNLDQTWDVSCDVSRVDCGSLIDGLYDWAMVLIESSSGTEVTSICNDPKKPIEKARWISRAV